MLEYTVILNCSLCATDDYVDFVVVAFKFLSKLMHDFVIAVAL